MNFLDVDFPEVTEAYRGSLEDWLELFERYAFPRTGDTETTAEMKRIFKRYTEVTYEDWLDRVIKCARDEIWYEEKINLSIRELYLVVRKYPRIVEKLKTIYNKFSISNNLLEQPVLPLETNLNNPDSSTIEVTKKCKHFVHSILNIIQATSVDSRHINMELKKSNLFIEIKKYLYNTNKSDQDTNLPIFLQDASTFYTALEQLLNTVSVERLTEEELKAIENSDKLRGMRKLHQTTLPLISTETYHKTYSNQQRKSLISRLYYDLHCVIVDIHNEKVYYNNFYPNDDEKEHFFVVLKNLLFDVRLTVLKNAAIFSNNANNEADVLTIESQDFDFATFGESDQDTSVLKRNSDEEKLYVKDKLITRYSDIDKYNIIDSKTKTKTKTWHKLSLFKNTSYQPDGWNKMGAIYCIRNFETGQSYYGLAVNLLVRTRQHATGRLGDSPDLHRAIRQRQNDNKLRIAILHKVEIPNKDDLKKRLASCEKAVIAATNAFDGYLHYNLSSGGQLGYTEVLGLAQALPYLKVLAYNNTKSYKALEKPYDHKTLLKYDILFVSQADREQITTIEDRKDPNNDPQQVKADIEIWLGADNNEVKAKLEEMLANEPIDENDLAKIYKEVKYAKDNSTTISPYYRPKVNDKPIKDFLTQHSAEIIRDNAAQQLINDLKENDSDTYKKLVILVNTPDINSQKSSERGPIETIKNIKDLVDELYNKLGEPEGESEDPS
jgi:hypothetical protein